MNTITRLTRNDLLALKERASFPAVSIYMPTHVVARGVGVDPTVLRNLLRRCEEELRGHRIPEKAIDGLLQDARTLQLDAHFWKEQRRGLALLISSSGTTCVMLDLDVSPMTHVGDQFLITPLLPLLSKDERFRVLAISRHGARAFEADSSSMNPVDAAGSLPSFDEYLSSFEVERNRQFNTSSAGGPGGRESTSFGHGSQDDETKRHLAEYFRQIDNRLHDHFHDPRIPMVLAGIEYTLPLYRSATRYGSIMEEGITVNPDDMNEHELHSKAWEIVQDVARKKRQEKVEQLNSLAGTGKTTTDLDQMAEAASQGRVEYLFVSDDETRKAPDDSTVYQINAAAIDTIRTGGEIITVPQGSLYDNASVAAVLRY